MPKSSTKWFNDAIWEDIVDSAIETIACLIVALIAAYLLGIPFEYWTRLIWVVLPARICQSFFDGYRVSPPRKNRSSSDSSSSQ